MKSLDLSVRSYVDMMYQMRSDPTKNHFYIKDAFMFSGRHPFFNTYDRIRGIANRNTGMLGLFEKAI